MKLTDLIAIGAVAWVFWASPPKSDINNVVTPTPTLQQTVAPIVSILKDSSDGKKIGGFFGQFADVVQRDSSVLTRTAQLRMTYQRAGTLMFQKTDLVGKYANLNAAIDKALTTSLGLKNAPINADKRAEAVEVLQAIQWACVKG